ncbi:hypothetical protein AAMO2058_001384800 [Amorphochlora amoebiformis]
MEARKTSVRARYVAQFAWLTGALIIIGNIGTHHKKRTLRGTCLNRLCASSPLRITPKKREGGKEKEGGVKVKVRVGDMVESFPDYNPKKLPPSFSLSALEQNETLISDTPTPPLADFGKGHWNGEDGEVSKLTTGMRTKYKLHPQLIQILSSNPEDDAFSIDTYLEEQTLNTTETQILEKALREQQVSDLKAWLINGGAEFVEGLEIKEYGAEVRGIEAGVDIHPGQPVVWIPEDYILTDVFASQSDIGQAVMRARGSEIGSNDTQYCLQAYLLQEKAKGSDSFWWPYIQTLPRNFYSHPLTWHKSEKKILMGSLSLKYINRILYQLQEDYNLLIRKIEGFERFSFKDFVWAHLVTSTRCYAIDHRSKKCSAMVPLADMFNHNLINPGGIWGFREDNKGFQVTAYTPIMKGEQISIPYGDFSNTKLFTNYGFQMPGIRPYESLIVVGTCERPFEIIPQYSAEGVQRMFYYLRKEIDFLMKNDEMFQKDNSLHLSSLQSRFNTLRNLLATPESDFLFGVDLKELPPCGGNEEERNMLPQMYAMEQEMRDSDVLDSKRLRDRVARECEAEKWDEVEVEAVASAAISRDNEIRVLQEIRRACIEGLMLYPTTLEKDIETVQNYSSAMTWRQKNAIVATAGEKTTLMYFVTMVFPNPNPNSNPNREP